MICFNKVSIQHHLKKDDFGISKVPLQCHVLFEPVCQYHCLPGKVADQLFSP